MCSRTCSSTQCSVRPGSETSAHSSPPTIRRWEGASSLDLLRRAYDEVRAAGFELASADCVLIGEKPRIAEYRDEMRAALAGAMGVDPALVNVRATTTDGLGFTGRSEGLAAQAVALVRPAT